MIDHGDGSRPSAEEDLIAAVRAGDRDAFGVLYERHRAAAFRTARRIAPDHMADDLVSEAFAQIYAALRAGSGPTQSFAAYLHACVRRTAYRFAQRRGHEPVEDYVSFSQKQILVAHPLDPEQSMFEDIEHSIVKNAFATLPEQHRLALWLAEVERATYTEIAEQLGVSASRVQSLLKSARRELSDAYVEVHIASPQISTNPPRYRPTPVLASKEHPSAFEIARYSRGRLRPTRRAVVHAHLRECVNCELRHQEALSVGSTLRAFLLPATLVPLGNQRPEARSWFGDRWSIRSLAVVPVIAAVALTTLVHVSNAQYDSPHVASTSHSASPEMHTSPTVHAPSSVAPTLGGQQPATTIQSPGSEAEPTSIPVLLPGVTVVYDNDAALDGAKTGETKTVGFTITADAILPAGAELRISLNESTILAAPYAECGLDGRDLVCPNVGTLPANTPIKGTLTLNVIKSHDAKLPILSVTTR